MLRRNSNILLEIAETVLLALLIFFVTRLVVQNFRVDGGSMLPALEDSEFLLVNKLAYVASNPERGDVLVFRSPVKPEEDLVKRVVGLPNETVELRDGGVYVDGRRLEEDAYFGGITMSRLSRTILVPEDGYFVLGDNRGQSLDSRSFGIVPGGSVVGQVWLVYWPPGRIGTVLGTRPTFAPVPERVTWLEAA